MTKSINSLETKVAAHPTDVANAFDDFKTTFEQFKETNDERLNEIERRGTSDPITEEKLARIDDKLNSLTLKTQRPALGGNNSSALLSPFANEHKSAFHNYIRSGQTQAHHSDLRTLEEKAMSISSDPDGGYLVPEETETEIGRLLANISPIRSLATVRQMSSSVFKKPFAISGPAVGWAGDTDLRPETASSTLAELEFPAMELYAMPAATSALLDDAAIDLDAWIAEEVQVAFAEQESAAFVAGDGNKKPTGFLNYAQVENSAWSWGNLGYLATGADAAFAANDPSDALVDMVYELRAGYRQNAHWVMNRRTQAAVRKLKDNDGNMG